MISQASTVDQYLQELPEDRKEPYLELMETIQSNIPEGFERVMQYGHPTYVVPHSMYPDGYHTTPKDGLPFVSIANQKQGIHLYHMGIYALPELLEWFVAEYPKHAKRKLDMGKSCIRFRNGSDIPYELIAQLMQKISVEEYVDLYESGRKKK